jgi:hypothetical protein
MLKNEKEEEVWMTRARENWKDSGGAPSGQAGVEEKDKAFLQQRGSDDPIPFSEFLSRRRLPVVWAILSTAPPSG